MAITSKEAISESIKYFDGDELAATTWVNKYALKDEDGVILERTPKDMHDRIISELLRVESKYNNDFTKDELEELFYHFKYLIPGGSAMSGIGNKYKHTSLSNCFVIDPPEDSYGSILKADEELIQLMKRRGGVGTDLSNLRPASALVSNDAKSSSGLASFMERFSNSTREVAQGGRRGALMLSVSISHPDAENFINAKLQEGKVTGANISVKITDKFMTAVKEHKRFLQVFPITTNEKDLNIKDLNELELNKLYRYGKENIYYKVIDANKLWMKIMQNNWKSAEPGILFEDNILRESPADYYKDFHTVSTNPCGEIPLCPYDSCRLLAINLYSFVENPFTEKAKFNFNKLKKVSRYAQQIMDDIIDLEIEHIVDIINKVESDPESKELKKVELDLWKNILDKTKRGRRTGIGITAEGDMLAALNIKYGTDQSIDFCTEVHKCIAVNCYEKSIELASVRGPFPEFSNTELNVNNNSNFIKRIYKEVSDEHKSLWMEIGRRNIACLTIAPTGTVSLMTQTTSGIEPAFKLWYVRRRKTNDKTKATFTDSTGDMFEEFNVIQYKFIEWYRINKKVNDSFSECKTHLENLSEEELIGIYKESPWYKATAQDINWVKKIELQGSVQKWIDHSISCTVNVPKETTVDIINNIYLAGYNSGVKGLTIYRDGSRDGVLISKNTVTEVPCKINKPRPDVVPAKLVRFKNNSENWIAFIGILDGSPYEIFCGKVDDDIRYLPKSVTEGKIVRVTTGDPIDGKIPHRYDFQYEIMYGYVNTLPSISSIFSSEYWNYARFISGMLRAGVPIIQIINVIKGLTQDTNTINTWRNGVARALKQFIKDGEKSGNVCSECGSELVFQGGCQICPNCGNSRCD